MSAASRGPPTPSEPAEGPPAAPPKAKVKEQIKMIVEDLELVLGDLKDVAKELKEVVDQIDHLTGDLRLEDDVTTDSSKTDSLDSSSSGATVSSAEKPRECSGPRPPPAPPAPPSAILTVLRRPRPPRPPPRLTPAGRAGPASHPVKTNGSLLRSGGGVRAVANGDACGLGPRGGGGSGLPEGGRAPRERVRFSETVQYHGAPGPAARRVRLLPPAPRLALLPAAPPLQNGEARPDFGDGGPAPPKAILRRSTTTTTV